MAMTTTAISNLTLTSKVLTSAPATLTIKANGTALSNGTYDGSSAKTVDITPASLGLGKSLTIQANGTTVGSYTGATDSTVNITAENLGLSTAYVPKGSITIAAANEALTSKTVGWVYNVTDSGTLTNGISGASSPAAIEVLAGDNIVVVEDGTYGKRWDKLSATIEVPEYTGSGAVSVANETVSLSIASGAALSQTNAGLKVDLDAAAISAGKTVKTATLGEILTLLGGTVS